MNKHKAIAWMQEKPFVFPASLFKNYKLLGLSDMQFLVILQLHQLREEGHSLPTPGQISQRMSVNEYECSKLLHELLSARFIEIKEVAVETGQVIEEEISLEPLFEKFYEFTSEESMEEDQETIKKIEGTLFETFENEFARPLTPMEMEMISMWLDEDLHEPTLIEAALKESVISSKLNFRYIDRILHDWKKSGVKSVEQAKKHGEEVRKHHTAAPLQLKVSKPHPGYNWLEGRS
ncbi:DnaD domain-containing protein [Alkalicoccus daliensis]|nr:DnaD domain-containing protein [Alkalicoccus daliensis]